MDPTESEKDTNIQDTKGHLTRELKSLGTGDDPILSRTTHKGRSVISYAGMVGGVAEEMFVQDNAFLSSFEPLHIGTTKSSTIQSRASASYLSSDNTYEDIHPRAYATKMQVRSHDNPNYGDVLKTSTVER